MLTSLAAVPTVHSKNMFDIPMKIMKKGFLTFFQELWREYGDLFLVKIGPRNMFLAVHPEHVRYISITNRQNFEKLQSYDVVRKLLLGDGILTSTGESWRKQRRLMSPFFAPRYLENYYTIIAEEGQALIERWETLAGTGETVDMMNEMMDVTASIILKAMFSINSGKELYEIRHAVETMIQFTASYQTNPLQPPLWVPTPRNRRYLRSRQLVHRYVQDIIAKRRQMKPEEWSDDLLSKLLLSRDEETGETMSDELIRDETITIFFAGHETTARTLTFLWHALSKNPAVAAKLHTELDDVLHGRIPSVEDLKILPYTLQVIKETLRLYPAAPVYVRDVIQDDSIDNAPIPAGSQVLLSPFLTHRHPDFWHNPETFDPDRFTPEREALQHPYAYHPFAAGQRICLGNNFSLFESLILVAIFAQRFAPQSPPNHELKLEMAGTLISKTGTPMKIALR